MGNDSLSLYQAGQQHLRIETREEFVSRQFYGWEMRGRGWRVCSYPVELEPPFRPFYFSPAAPQSHVWDDGRKPTFLSRLADRLAGKTILQNSQPQLSDQNEIEDDEPDFCRYRGEDFVEYKLILPKDLRITKPVSEQLILSFGALPAPASFEVIGTNESVRIQFAAAEFCASQVKAQLTAHLPGASVSETTDSLSNAWEESQGAGVIVDFGLSREFMLPLQTISSFEIDSLVAAVGALSHLNRGETGVLQILFQPVRFPWAEAMLDAVRNFDGTPFFANAPEMIPLTKEKISRPLFAVVIRVAARSRTSSRAMGIARNIAGAFASLSNPIGNELIPLSNDDYHPADHEECFLERHSYRTGMILNSEELASLAHPPSQAVQSEKLIRDSKKTKAAPAQALNNGLVLGQNEHNGVSREVSLNAEQRTRHVYLIGASGSGKSTLLLNLILQDMRNGDGLCLLDPHGDLIDDVLARVPDARINDVILFDPSDAEHPIGFNVLQANSESEKTLIASDLVAAFRRFSTSWGDVMDSVLANAVLAVLENSRGGTLFDLKRLLIEKEFRAEYLESVEDEAVRYFWQYEYPALAGRSQSSVLVRLDQFLRQKLVRNIVCQKENKLNFREVMDNRRILLIRLSGGLIGAENASLLGTLLVSKIQQIALSRQDTESARRPYFWLYLDEFHHFITPSTESLLSGIRKYKIGLHLAHQEFRQLQSRDLEVAHSVLSNCATRVCFRLGDADAERFAAGFGFFDKDHLQNLSVGEAVGRIERAEWDFNLKTAGLSPVSAHIAANKKNAIIRLTRERYAAAKENVEAELRIRRAESPSQKADNALRQPVFNELGQVESKQTEEKIDNEIPLSTTEKPSPVLNKRSESEGNKLIKPSAGAETSAALHRVSQTVPSKDENTKNRQHLYLQSLVKRMAEARGFKASTEKEVFGGAGKIDVALEREDLRIAVEISVTTPPDYELQNIQKCLAAGFLPVVVIAERRQRDNIRRLAEESLSGDDFEKVLFLEPEEFNSFLENIPAETLREGRRVKGFRVNLKLKKDDDVEQKAKRNVVSEVILKAFKKLKKNDS